VEAVAVVKTVTPAALKGVETRKIVKGELEVTAYVMGGKIVLSATDYATLGIEPASKPVQVIEDENYHLVMTELTAAGWEGRIEGETIHVSPPSEE
jgi:hypothetical protein